MKDIYNPDREDIIEWTNGNLGWPAAGWVGYVSDSECDDLIYEFANNSDSITKSKRLKSFFIHVLYFFVGDHFSHYRDSNYSTNRLNRLLDRVNSSSSHELKKWKTETLRLLSGETKYDSAYWLDHDVYDEILKNRESE